MIQVGQTCSRAIMIMFILLKIKELERYDAELTAINMSSWLDLE